MISIQLCEHCGAVKDAEPPAEILQTLKKIGWELKRAEGKPRAATVAEKAPKKKESREENSNHSEEIDTVSVAEEPVAV